MTTQIPRRPNRCGVCSMFGHNRRNCHNVLTTHTPPGYYPDWAADMYTLHCEINQRWIAAGGAGHTVPEPTEPPPQKTPFELACENDCKITCTDECCICMESLDEKNKMIAPCGHQFHFGCIVQNINRSDKCPMCRAVICPEIPKSIMKFPRENDILTISRGTARQLTSAMEEMGAIASREPNLIVEIITQGMGGQLLMLLRSIRRSNE